VNHTQSYSHLPTWLGLTALIAGLTLAFFSKKLAEWNVRWIDSANRGLVKIFRLPGEEERAWVSLQGSPALQTWRLASTWVGILVVSAILAGIGAFALWQGPPGTK